MGEDRDYWLIMSRPYDRQDRPYDRQDRPYDRQDIILFLKLNIPEADSDTLDVLSILVFLFNKYIILIQFYAVMVDINVRTEHASCQNGGAIMKKTAQIMLMKLTAVSNQAKC